LARLRPCASYKDKGRRAQRPVAGRAGRQRYPNAIFDEEIGRWISEAEVAETTDTALVGTKHAYTARLIVRRVPHHDPKQPAAHDRDLAVDVIDQRHSPLVTSTSIEA
jgi:hypothetical protein